MSGFSIDWLDLREDADRRARDPRLLEMAKAWLQANPTLASPPVVLDLGAGTGSTLRAFRHPNANSAPLAWRLVDNDKVLLNEAQRRHGDACSLEICPMDLTEVNRLSLTGVQLVTASALFDLVSEYFIRELATLLAEASQLAPVGLYATLNYDGTTEWTPGHTLDKDVLQIFNQDQHSDKGFGQALGPDAGNLIEAVFSESGFQVHCAPTPWQLDGKDAAMVDTLISGISTAVAQHGEIDSVALEEWTRFRKAHLETGTCVVGHTDLLALPNC